jgi:preprotein translocase subunit Sec61beta
MQAECVPPAVLEQGFSLKDLTQFMAFFCRRMFTMAASLRSTRLRVATTACVYFQRFFQHYTIAQQDPRVVAAACIYVAGVITLPSHPPFPWSRGLEARVLGWAQRWS